MSCICQLYGPGYDTLLHHDWLTIPMSVFSVKSGFEKKKLKASVLDSTEPLSSPEHV